jgi:hypothetical protein
MNQISYINKVAIAIAGKMTTIRHDRWAWVKAGDTFTDIPIKGLATLNVEETIDDKAVIYTSTLTMTVDTDKFPQLDKVAVRMGTVNGGSLLMGDEHRPWVQCTVSKSHPESVGSPCVTTVKAVWTGPRKPAVLK